MLRFGVIRACDSGLIIPRLNDLLSAVLAPLPGQQHMTSRVHYTILLFIYIDRPTSILGGSCFFLRWVEIPICPFPIWSMHEQFPTFASDFTARDSWESVLLVLCVGVLCFRAAHMDVCLWRWKAQRVRGLSLALSGAFSSRRGEMWPVVWIPFS